MAGVKVTKANYRQLMRDPSNWHKTSRKRYDAYVCRPPIGTVIKNRARRAINGNRECVTTQEVQFILSDTTGQLIPIDFNQLCAEYTNYDGTPLDAAFLQRRVNKVSQVIDWIHVVAKVGPMKDSYFAFRIPESVQTLEQEGLTGVMINCPGIDHGHGDVIMCPNVNGMPDFSRITVVNGASFPNEYDLRGFQSDYGMIASVKPTPVPRSIVNGAQLPGDGLVISNMRGGVNNTVIRNVNPLANQTGGFPGGVQPQVTQAPLTSMPGHVPGGIPNLLNNGSANPGSILKKNGIGN